MTSYVQLPDISKKEWEKERERERERETERERENEIDEKVRRKNISLKGPPHSLLFLYLFFTSRPLAIKKRETCV